MTLLKSGMLSAKPAPGEAPKRILTTTGAVADAKLVKQAQGLYDKNITLVMDKVRAGKRGMYRALMDQSGLIVSITPCRAARPQPGCFSLFIPGNGKPPRFGTLEHLEGFRARLAGHMKDDTEELLKTGEAAYLLQSETSKESVAPVVAKHIQLQVDELAGRFGDLPEPALKLADDSAKAKELDEERERRKEAERQAEKERIFDEEAPSVAELLKEMQDEDALKGAQDQDVQLRKKPPAPPGF